MERPSMSLSSIMNIGVSGLQTAQEQLRVTSDNITNVNTPGYIRKVANQESLVANGVSMGVTAGQVTLAADKYLQAAQFKATSASSQASASYDLLDQIQSQFGDLTDPNGLFNQAAATLTSTAQAAESPTSSATRQQVIANLQSFLSEGSRIAGKIQDIRADADSRISTDVASINDLLKNITQLNTQISSGTVTGSDVTGAQTTQTKYIQDLSKLIDVNISTDSTGGVTVRTQSGLTLANAASHVTLSYQPASTVSATTTFNPIVVTGPNGENRDLADNLSSGELKGLIDVRDNASVAVNDQLNQYMTQFANTLNAAHNASSAVPAPASLTGKNLSQT
ncbi:MAG: flagellar hook-associated protein FlgK, partial [Asticcacaulis sp.]